MPTLTLYGSPLSLYTGRARSYLIKAGINYRELLPNSEHFTDNVLPALGGRRSIPVVETDSGEVIRDGAAIIDHFEDQSGHEFSPRSVKQRILSQLFDVIGAEGLLRPAMHYRWNFPEENQEFLQFHFESFVPSGYEKKETATRNMDRMRNAGRSFGVRPETFEIIESLYCELLEKLNIHFGNSPYLLGTKPCIGDFGMIAPLYGHLGRDPKPLALMQKNSIRLFRWVERMNRPEADIGEFDNTQIAYLPDDTVTDSLIDVLRHLAIDFVPETKAACEFINEWISEQGDIEPETIVERGVGMAEFDIKGEKIIALAQPYRFYLLQRVQSEFDLLADNDKQEVESLLSDCGMSEVIGLRLTRTIGRKNNREVWL